MSLLFPYKVQTDSESSVLTDFPSTPVAFSLPNSNDMAGITRTESMVISG